MRTTPIQDLKNRKVNDLTDKLLIAIFGEEKTEKALGLRYRERKQRRLKQLNN